MLGESRPWMIVLFCLRAERILVPPLFFFVRAENCQEMQDCVLPCLGKEFSLIPLVIHQEMMKMERWLGWFYLRIELSFQVFLVRWDFFVDYIAANSFRVFDDDWI